MVWPNKHIIGSLWEWKKCRLCGTNNSYSIWCFNSILVSKHILIHTIKIKFDVFFPFFLFQFNGEILAQILCSCCKVFQENFRKAIWISYITNCQKTKTFTFYVSLSYYYFFPFFVHCVLQSSTVPLSGSSPAFVATFRSYKSILCFGCSFIFLRFFDHPWRGCIQLLPKSSQTNYWYKEPRELSQLGGQIFSHLSNFGI